MNALGLVAEALVAESSSWSSNLMPTIVGALLGGSATLIAGTVQHRREQKAALDRERRQAAAALEEQRRARERAAAEQCAQLLQILERAAIDLTHHGGEQVIERVASAADALRTRSLDLPRTIRVRVEEAANLLRDAHDISGYRHGHLLHYAHDQSIIREVAAQTLVDLAAFLHDEPLPHKSGLLVELEAVYAEYRDLVEAAQDRNEREYEDRRRRFFDDRPQLREVARQADAQRARDLRDGAPGRRA